jgi:hypothetical protein
VQYNGKRRSDVTGMRLREASREKLHREAERTGRFPALIVSDLIDTYLDPDGPQPTFREPHTAATSA